MLVKKMIHLIVKITTIPTLYTPKTYSKMKTISDNKCTNQIELDFV